MNLKALPLTVIFLVSLASGSCKKETSDDLQKQADEFQAYLIGKHFVPDAFYASRPIDYDLTDSDPTPSQDLEKYILKHLFDDSIVFKPNEVHPEQKMTWIQRLSGRGRLKHQKRKTRSC